MYTLCFPEGSIRGGENPFIFAPGNSEKIRIPNHVGFVGFVLHCHLQLTISWPGLIKGIYILFFH